MNTARGYAPYLICHAKDQGVIARYHLDNAVIDTQMAKLIEGGADGFSLSPWLFKGQNDGLYLDWKDGQLAPQYATNLANLLKRMRELGANWVQIAPQFYGPNDFRASWGGQFIESLYEEAWTFFCWLHDLCVSTRIPFLLDLCTEVTVCEYSKRLWTDYTGWFWPGGVPCWDATMSVVPTDPNIRALPELFRGLNTGGPVNAPVYQNVHAYGGSEYGPTLYDTLVGSHAALQRAGFQNFILIGGEAFSLTQPQDAALAQQARQFAIDTKQLIERVCPWPVDPRTPEGQSIDMIPANPGKAWKDAGF